MTRMTSSSPAMSIREKRMNSNTKRHATMKRKTRVIVSLIMIVLFLSSCTNSCGASSPYGTPGAASGTAAPASGQASGQADDQAVSPDTAGNQTETEQSEGNDKNKNSGNKADNSGSGQGTGTGKPDGQSSSGQQSSAETDVQGSAESFESNPYTKKIPEDELPEPGTEPGPGIDSGKSSDTPYEPSGSDANDSSSNSDGSLYGEEDTDF